MTHEVVLRLSTTALKGFGETNLEIRLRADHEDVAEYWQQRFVEFQKMLDVQARLEGADASHTP